MKSKKQLMLILPALLTIGLVAAPLSACKRGNTPTSVVEASLSVSPKKATIYLNDSETIQLTATLENGGGKTLVWSSLDSTIASVNDAGLVTGHKLGVTTITVATNDGSVSDSATITVKQDRTQEDTVNSLQKPTFLVNYESKTATLDDVASIQTNHNPSRTSYYKNAQGTRDVYKVGNQNEFKAQITGVAIDSETLEDTEIANPFTLITVEKFNNGTQQYEAIPDASLSAHVVINQAHNGYKFAADTVGNRYKITVSVDASKYSSVSEYCSPVVMEVEVFEGVNVYNKQELAVMDNWQAAWNDTKVAAGVGDIDAKGVALHSNITLTNDDMPSEFKYSQADIEKYISDYPNNWTDYVNKKRDNRPTQAERESFTAADAKANLVDSLKDWTTVFNRKTSENATFTFEGNYNTIDYSGIKQIFVFGSNTLANGKVSEEYFPNSNGSHGQFFGFNTELENNPPFIGQGENYFKNLTIIGNGDRSSDDNYEGGLIAFKVRSTDMHYQNVLSSKTFITFMAERDKDEREEAIHIDTRTYMDRCKSFDSYNSMMYVWGTETNIITNSVMNGAGGAIALLDDVNADDAASKTHGTPKVDAFNVYFENLLTGQEPWFVNHQASALVQLMELFGSPEMWLGRNAVAHGDHMNIATADAQGHPFIDLVAIDICGGNPLGNLLTQGGQPLKGHFNIYNDAAMTQIAASLDMSKMAAADPREGQEAFVGNVLAQYAAGNVLPLYRLMAQSAGGPGMVVETSAGGHGMLFEDTYHNGVVGTLNFPNYSALPIASYAQTIVPGYEVDPFPFYADATGTGAEVAANLGLADNMNKLASGNYLSLYLQAPVMDGETLVGICEYLGAFIQMHQLGA